MSTAGQVHDTIDTDYIFRAGTGRIPVQSGCASARTAVCEYRLLTHGGEPQHIRNNNKSTKRSHSDIALVRTPSIAPPHHCGTYSKDNRKLTNNANLQSQSEIRSPLKRRSLYTFSTTGFHTQQSLEQTPLNLKHRPQQRNPFLPAAVSS
jgi:hypothetical protein